MNTCKKTSYSTEAFANIDLERFKKSKRSNIPTRAYLCAKCNTWHLTSDNKVLFDKIALLEQEIISLKQQATKGDIHKERLHRKKEVENLKIQYQYRYDKLDKKYKALQLVMSEIRNDYQPVKTTIHKKRR